MTTHNGAVVCCCMFSMVSAITSLARTGAKVYYQSGPMAAMLGGVDIGSLSATNVHASH